MSGKDVGYDHDDAPEEFYDEWKNLKTKRYGSGRRAAEQYADDKVGPYDNYYSYYGNDGWRGDVTNSFRSRGRGRGDVNVNFVSELLVQMQQTAALLERFVVAATANRRSTPGRRRPTPKNAEEDIRTPATSKAEETARTVTDHFRKRPTTDGERRANSRRPEKNSRRRGDRDRSMLHVTLLGSLKRRPAGIDDRRAPKREIVTAPKSHVDTSEKKTSVQKDGSRGQLEQRVQSERHQRPEVDEPRTLPKDEEQEDDNDDDIEVMSDRIRSIIADPLSSFSYENISADDMVSLEEMVSQSSQFGTMKLVEQDEDEEATKKNDGTTTVTTLVPGGDGSKAVKEGGDVMAKPAEEVSEAADRTGASDAATSDSEPEIV